MTLDPNDDRNTEPYPANYPLAWAGTQLHFLQRQLWRAGCKWGQADDWECPSHPDSTASLGVGQGERGVVLCCAAGCAPGDVLAALGTSWAVVLSYEPGEPAHARGVSGIGGTPKSQLVDIGALVEKHGPVVATHTYSYWTPDERLTRKVRRREFLDGHKQITQRVLDKDTPALYRQDLVSLALKEGLPIYVMEGEKKAADFNEYAAGRAVATSAPGGAGKWTMGHAALLRGAPRVMIVADRDKPGMTHALMVGRTLDEIVAYKIVCSATEGKGDDWIDHRAAGFGAKDLVAAPRPELEQLDSVDSVDASIDADADYGDEVDADFARKRAEWEGSIWPSANLPLKVAQKLVEKVFRDDTGRRTLIYWRSEWWVWTDGRWIPQEEVGLMGQISNFLDNVRCQTAAKAPEIVPWNPTDTKVTGVFKMLRGLVHIEGDTEPGTVFSTGKPRDLLGLRDVVLDLSPDGEFRQLRPSADFFTLNALPYNFDPDAGCPRWLQFLDETWPGDPESALLLQEWFGYVLTHDTSFQKFLAIYGAPATGKSTIERVLVKLLGRGGVATPTIESLGAPEGMADLVNAQLAILGDVRFTGKDNQPIVRAILQIVGEDSVRIRQLYAKAYTAPKIPTRLMLIANERPALRDTTSAITRRLMLLETVHPIPVSARDPQLFEKLEAEMPGIINWSLVGLARLRRQGSFTTPRSTLSEMREIDRAHSPLREFGEDWCVLEPDASIPVQSFCDSYRCWLLEQGEPFAPSNSTIVRELRSTFPGQIERVLRGNSRAGTQHRALLGIRTLGRNINVQDQ